MLRHKALSQCARVAFGMHDVIDHDEADRVRVCETEIDVTPKDNNRIFDMEI